MRSTVGPLAGPLGDVSNADADEVAAFMLGVFTTLDFDDNTGELLGTGSALGNKMVAEDGSGFVIVSVPIDESKVTTRDSFCIVATSSDDRVFDRAPDTGCTSFPASGTGGQQNFG